MGRRQGTKTVVAGMNEGGWPRKRGEAAGPKVSGDEWREGREQVGMKLVNLLSPLGVYENQSYTLLLL